jgi:hypothetical protein
MRHLEITHSNWIWQKFNQLIQQKVSGQQQSQRRVLFVSIGIERDRVLRMAIAQLPHP